MRILRPENQACYNPNAREKLSKGDFSRRDRSHVRAFCSIQEGEHEKELEVGILI